MNPETLVSVRLVKNFAFCTSFVARAISNDNNNKFQYAYRKDYSRESVCNECLKSFRKNTCLPCHDLFCSARKTSNVINGKQ